MQNKLTSWLIVGAIALSTIFLLRQQIIWGVILASYYFAGAPETYEPWDGCANPTSQAELDEWIAHSNATGEPLCNPDVVNLEFPESTETD
ncbi:MAG: hypothetical protein AAFV90_22420 [Cyanobacteria bacterium J06634_5]